jgi:class 3 adenylate cyclase
MGLDEAGTGEALREHRAAANPIIAEHGARIVKTIGDGVLIEFGSVVSAVEFALGLQRLADERNAGTPTERRTEWRIGVHLGWAGEAPERTWDEPGRRTRGWSGGAVS